LGSGLERKKYKYKYVKVRLTSDSIKFLEDLSSRYSTYKRSELVEEGLRLLSTLTELLNVEPCKVVQTFLKMLGKPVSKE